MKWKVTKEWEGEDVFILGGGPSLRGFDWSRLDGHRTIGCNSAFIHGPRVCNLCFFSDCEWFERFKDELQEYHRQGGRVATHCEYVSRDLDWVLWLQRHMKSMEVDGTIFHGYGGNSGSGALHLALLMGARRVFLLGFDGQLGKEGESNWHTRTIDQPNAKVYHKFKESWEYIAAHYQKVFPGTEIWNCNPDSAITHFPKTDLHVETTRHMKECVA